MPTTTLDDVARDALKLARRWHEHRNGLIASLNTIFAVFGVKSPLGRFADTTAFNNAGFGIWLEDIAFDHGASSDELRKPFDETWNSKTTSAAASYNDNGFGRLPDGSARIDARD
jgi:hypothetical protein